MDFEINSKGEIRKYIRAERKKKTLEQFCKWSAEICNQLLTNPVVNHADTIAAYYPLPDEPDIRPLIQKLYQQGKTILLPHVINDTEMTFFPYEGEKELIEGAFHIMESKIKVTSYKEKYGKILFLIPGMAFTTNGKRLGRGKGYYDRFLANVEYDKLKVSNISTIYKIGICYPYQVLDDIPIEKNDILMDEVIF